MKFKDYLINIAEVNNIMWANILKKENNKIFYGLVTKYILYKKYNN